MADGPRRTPRWYFGGVASCFAVCITHPIDLVKVHLQTQQKATLGIKDIVSHIIKSDGVIGLYSGISASLFRQATYSTARFGIYEYIKNNYLSGASTGFGAMLLGAGIAGAIGGFIGTPGDVVNVRMQNDMKLPKKKRRNYHNALHGLYRISVDEGPTKTFSGATTTTTRGFAMTVGQVAGYDIVKYTMLKSGHFVDGTLTHVLCSAISGFIATVLTQPIDVVKTRYMNAKPGEFAGLMGVIKYTAEMGPGGFFKGFIPAYVRIAPQNVIVFVIYEYLTKNFGYIANN